MNSKQVQIVEIPMSNLEQLHKLWENKDVRIVDMRPCYITQGNKYTAAHPTYERDPFMFNLDGRVFYGLHVRIESRFCVWTPSDCALMIEPVEVFCNRMKAMREVEEAEGKTLRALGA